MQRFLSILLVTLALVVGAVGVAPIAHAQVGGECTDDRDCGGFVCDLNTMLCSDIPVENDNDVVGQQDSSDNQEITEGANKETTPIDQEEKVYAGVMVWAMKLFAWLVGVSAITLDNAVYYTVVTMGDYVSNLSAVGVAWRILRDLSNILLIFGFLAIGISIILNADWYGGGAKLLPKLLIAAVLLNFSLFITEAVIDVGNLFATQFYTQINGGNPAGVQNLSDISHATDNGISSKIMGQLGLQTIYGDAIRSENVFQAGNQFIIGFMGIILFIITAFVMFSLSFILIARFVILIFVIILAPIGIVGYAIPQLSKYGTMWKDKLVEQTIVAPVLLLLLYVALAVITDANFLIGFDTGDSGPSLLGWIDNDNLTGFASAILSFFVAMGLLLAVVIAAKNLSKTTAGFATKWGGKVTGGIVGHGIFGGASLIGRSTLGVTGRLLNSKSMQARAARGGIGSKLLVTSGKFLSNRTYDARNINKVPGLGRVTGAATGVLGGVLATGGAGEISKGIGGGATVTAQKAIDTTLGAPKAVREYFREQQKGYEKSASELERKKIFDNPTTSNPADIRKELSKTPIKELEELDGIRKGIKELVTNLSPQQFESLMKSDNLSPAEKSNIREERFRDLKEKIDIATAVGATQPQIDDARKELGKINQKELPLMDRTLLANDFVRDNMTNDQYDSVSKEGILSPTEKVAFDTRRKSRFEPSATNPVTNVAEAIKTLKWNKDQINKLPANTLTNTGILDALGPEALNIIDIARKGNLSPADRKKLGDYLEDIASSPTDPRGPLFLAYVTTDARVKGDLLIT